MTNPSNKALKIFASITPETMCGSSPFGSLEFPTSKIPSRVARSTWVSLWQEPSSKQHGAKIINQQRNVTLQIMTASLKNAGEFLGNRIFSTIQRGTRGLLMLACFQ